MEKKKKKILIIEDERLLLDMYESYFEKAGYEVFTAKNGRLGVEIAKTEKPDLIVTDIVMPDMDGYDVIQKIRGDITTKKIPILVFSNLGQKEEIKKGIELGADDYVIKTDLTPAELLAKIEEMFSKWKNKGSLLK